MKPKIEVTAIDPQNEDGASLLQAQINSAYSNMPENVFDDVVFDLVCYGFVLPETQSRFQAEFVKALPGT
jgi:hypothetical protein